MIIRNNKVLLSTIFVSILIAPVFSSAEPINRYEKMYDNCVKKAGPINNNIVHQCSAIVSDTVKKEINQLYETIHKNISKQSVDDAKKFENSQKLWLKYREKHCELMGSYVGSPMYSFCPMKLNKLRALELRELAGK
jgi:uncharacterized protein YecT (DUF1311 family)